MASLGVPRTDRSAPIKTSNRYGAPLIPPRASHAAYSLMRRRPSGKLPRHGSARGFHATGWSSHPSTATAPVGGAAPARRPGPHGPLRHRRPERGRHLVRAGRLPAVLLLRPGRALQRPGRDRVVLRCQRSPGRLARQGSSVLRWALFEAAKSASRTTSSDHAYYVAVRDRLGGKRPALSVARKLVRRCHHTLREPGGEAWTPLRPPVEAKQAA